MAVNYDLDQFRKYLQESGAVESLSRVFLKLYELKGNRPKSSVKFIQDRIIDCVPSLTEYEKLMENLNTMGEILLHLKSNGKLDSSQLDAFDKIDIRTTIPFVQKEARPRISARHSQIGFGNAWKKDNTLTVSKIRQLNKLDTDYDTKIEAAITNLYNNRSCSSMLKTFIGTFYTTYKSEKVGTSPNETTFVDCICSGLDIHDSTICVYATDADAYETFADFFNLIITNYHKCAIPKSHPASDWGEPNNLSEIDQGQYILWTRVRCVRNVDAFALVPKLDSTKLKELQTAIKTAFTELSKIKDLDGDWYELDDNSMDPGTRKELIDNNYILEHGDKFLESVGATQDWPAGRAVYINKKKTFFVWINEEDHLRFISMESGSKIGDIYKRLKEALEALTTGAQPLLTFKRNARLGFVSLCPSNLGNTIRASVMIKLPKLTNSKNEKQLHDLIADHNFEIRSQTSDTIEISNKTKLGLTEIQSIENFCQGINAIIEAEKKLKNIKKLVAQE